MFGSTRRPGLRGHNSLTLGSLGGSSLGGAEIEAEIDHKLLNNSNSGFLDQINSYVRNQGQFIARVGGKATDPKTRIEFKRPYAVPAVWGILAGVAAIAYSIGKRK